MTRKIQASPTSSSFVDGLLAGQPDWQEALCAQSDPDAWFPGKGEPAGPAKAICFTCADQIGCLEWAMENHELIGVWGGTTERERHRLARDRGIDWRDNKWRRAVDVGLPPRQPARTEVAQAARRRNVAIARESKKGAA